MPAAALPLDEDQRLTALRAYEILDTPPEAAFDRLTELASALLETPIALVSLTDSNRQWFKSRVGLESHDVPRELSFCAHAILQADNTLVVPDAVNDERFRDNPLVVGTPGIRFYAGAPIVTRDGYALGTVCTIDNKPRHDVRLREIMVLKNLAAIAADELELRLLARQLRNETRHREALQAKAHTEQVGRLRAESEAVRQRAAATLMDISGGVAHEFNNLFGGLMLLADNLRAAAGDHPAMHGSIDPMLEALRRGARLTHGLQAYSGLQHLDPRLLDLSAVLKRAGETLRAVHGAALSLDIRVAGDCAKIDADERQLVAALAELIANGRDAATTTPARVSVLADNGVSAADMAHFDDHGMGRRFVRITVEDEGRGMSADIRERACEPFYTTKPVGAGPGLGLSLVQGFARQSGGFLTIEARPGGGTIVALHLPSVSDRAEGPSRQSAA